MGLGLGLGLGFLSLTLTLTLTQIKKFISIPTGFKGLGYFEEGAAGKHKVLWSSRSPGTLTMTRALALALTRILPLALALTQP